MKTATLPVAAPVRRSLESRPRAPRPPGRDRKHSRSPIGALLTRITQPLDRSAIGAHLRRNLRKSCQFRPVQVQLTRYAPDLDGMRLVLLSDLHAGFYMAAVEFLELAERISSWSPDVICLVGDMIDRDPSELDLLFPGLNALRAKHAVVAVPGNHEYSAEPDLFHFLETMEVAGVRVLLNRGLRLQRGSDSLWLAGVDDLTAGEPDLERALDGLHDDEPAILLSHHPDLFCEAAHVGIDLTLSGHTHGGQITWSGKPLLPGAHFTKFGYWGGRYQIDGAQLLVGRGAGVCVLPFRVGVPPEVLMIELRVNFGDRPQRS